MTQPDGYATPAPDRLRCKCRSEWETRCHAYATEEDLLCDPCRGRPLNDEGLHWCTRSSTWPSIEDHLRLNAKEH